jgi:hypothetical protein
MKPDRLRATLWIGSHQRIDHNRLGKPACFATVLGFAFAKRALLIRWLDVCNGSSAAQRSAGKAS